MIEFHNIILWNRKQTEFYYSTRFPFSATQLNWSHGFIFIAQNIFVTKNKSYESVSKKYLQTRYPMH